MSTLFVRTLRDDPADAEVPSHRLLVRAGYIRRAAPGHLHLAAARLRVCATSSASSARRWTPIGAQELHFPALLPREPYEATGRWTEYGDGIFRLKDRKGGDYLLGPTHEEMFTLAGEGPVLVVQGPAAVDLPDPDQVPRRGASPRRAAARARVRDEGLLLLRHRRRRARRVLPAHRDAYIRIFDRLGFDYVIVAAMSGAMGGSKSARSSSPRADVGEDTYVRCTLCDYAANVEAVAGAPARAVVPYDDAPAAHAEQTRRTPRRSTRSSTTSTSKYPRDDRDWAAGDTLKNVVVTVAHPDGTTRGARHRRARRPRGRREAARGAARQPAEVEPFSEEDFAAARAGQGLHRPRRAGGEEAPPASATSSTRASSTGTRWVTGADVAGQPRARPRRRPRLHPRRHDRGRRGARRRPLPELRRRRPRVARAASRSATSSSSAASTPRRSDLKVLDENGKPVTVTMGSYGIGVSRAVAAIAEGTLDELGLCWPREVAPADVHIVATGKDDAVFAAADAARRRARAGGRHACCSTIGPVSPGREVQGRRADRRPDDRRRRPRPRRRRHRGQGPAVPASARTCPAADAVAHLAALVHP